MPLQYACGITTEINDQNSIQSKSRDFILTVLFPPTLLDIYTPTLSEKEEKNTIKP